MGLHNPRLQAPVVKPAMAYECFTQPEGAHLHPLTLALTRAPTAHYEGEGEHTSVVGVPVAPPLTRALRSDRCKISRDENIKEKENETDLASYLLLQMICTCMYREKRSLDASNAN